MSTQNTKKIYGVMAPVPRWRAQFFCWRGLSRRLWQHLLPPRPAALRTWCWSMAPLPMAPAGKPSRRFSKKMATRCRWRSRRRPRTQRTSSTRRRPSTPSAGRLSWSAIATADPSSARPATIQTLQHWFTSLHLRWMRVKAARQSNRPLRKPPRRSSRIATETGG